MAHLKNYKLSEAVAVLRHDERQDTDKVISRKNECIDKSRTHLNYNLAQHRTASGLMTHIENICENNHVRLNRRKDLNVMSSWIVTLPKNIPAEKAKVFFQQTYNFLSAKYGEQNVLSATVHMDETTPHLHFCFIPVAYDKQNNRYTVSAKLLHTRKALQTFHIELEKYLRKNMQMNVEILNEATKNGNREIRELKLQAVKKEIENAEEAVKRSETRLKSLQGQILKQEEVNALKGKKTLTGALRGVSYNDWLNVYATARYVDETIEETKKKQEKADEIISQCDDIIQAAERIASRKAAVITAEANVKADAVTSAAKRKKEEIKRQLSGISTQLTELKEKYKEIEELLNAENDRLQQIRQETVIKQQELENLQKKISEAKSSMPQKRKAMHS